MTSEVIDFVRRATPTAPASTALGARSAMWTRFHPGAYEDRQIRPWVKVIWSLSGKGAIRLSGRTHGLSPGEVAVFFPGMCHEAWADAAAGECWEARWITMDGPLCGAFAQAVGLHRAGIYHPRGNLKPLFDRYRECIGAATPEGARQAELVAHELLASLSEAACPASVSNDDPVVTEAMALLQLNWPQPTCGIAQVADRIGVHRSVLSRRFLQRVGISPLHYLMNLRMGNAMTLLRSTDLSIGAIACQCGFSDPGYFSRAFRRAQGVTPLRFRESRDS